MTHQSRIRSVAVVVVAVTGVVAACGPDSEDADVPSGEVTSLTAEQVERATPPSNAPVSETVRGMQDLSYQVVRTGGEPADNLLVSPMSIAYAFAMVRAGVRW